MTQGELEKIPQRIVNEMSRLEVRIMEDMVRRIRINGFSTASSDWQFTRLQQLGMSEEQIKKWVQEVLETSDKEIEKIYSDDTYKEYMKHSRAFDIYGQEQLPFSENAELQSLIEAVKQQTREELENITGSMGFVKPTPSGGLQMMTQTEFYQRTLDDAMYDIHSGAFDYNTVLRRTIEDMTRSGIRWIDYESGHHNRIPVAARRAVMTGFRQVQGKINEQTARALGTDFYEVTVHIGARPSHQVWEGQVWSMEQLQSVCGLGTVTGLHGANCYHDYNAFIPGVSTRTYTDEQLEQIHEEENKPKTYNGKEYTTYEALQRQRQLETRARKYREDVHLLEEGGGSEDDIIAKKSRYQKTLQEYKAFSKKMGLPMQKERIYQDGLNVDIPERDLSKVAAAKPKAEIKRRAINKAGKEVVFDFKEVDDKRQKQIDILSELTMEYNTRLERVSHGAQNAAGDVQISGSLMRLSDKNVETAVHEFAHTLANTDADKYGLTQDQEFWKEIRKIRREYLKDVDATQDPSRIISFYEHSSRSVDEFFAEAFTHAKLREMGLPIPERFGGDYTYSQRVLDTVNKYFGKDPGEAGRLARLAERQAKKERLQEMLKNGVTIGTPYIEPEQIRSQAFSSKFSRITDNSAINNRIRSLAQGNLTKNNGSYTEMLDIIDLDTGDSIIHKLGGKDEIGVSLTVGERAAVKDHKGRIIGMHNHPTNIYPTGSDFVIAASRKYEFGLVFTHDLRVFKYTGPTIKTTATAIDDVIDRCTRVAYTEIDKRRAFERAMVELERRFGITWQEI